MIELDHLAVAGETLAEAVAHVEDALGVEMAAGGVHVEMGTHNRLLSLGPGMYLEAIAVDPAARGPDRPRWFDLDRFQGRPRLCELDRPHLGPCRDARRGAGGARRADPAQPRPLRLDDGNSGDRPAAL